MEHAHNIDTIHVLDTGAFISYASRSYAERLCVTTYRVLEELKSMESRVALDVLIKQGLEILEPEPKQMEAVKRLAGEINEKVSEADMSIVALAKQLRDRDKDVVVISDDYSVQNLCKILGIKFEGIEKKGIKNRLVWIKKCSICGRMAKGSVCHHCGSEEFRFVPLKRKIR